MASTKPPKIPSTATAASSSSNSTTSTKTTALLNEHSFSASSSEVLWKPEDMMLRSVCLKWAKSQHILGLKAQSDSINLATHSGLIDQDSEILESLSIVISRITARRNLYCSPGIAIRLPVIAKFHFNRILTQCHMLKSRVYFKFGAKAAALAELKVAFDLIFENSPRNKRPPHAPLPRPDDTQLFPKLDARASMDLRKRYLACLLYRAEILIEVADFQEAKRHFDATGVTIPKTAFYVEFLRGKMYRGMKDLKLAELHFVNAAGAGKAMKFLRPITEILIHRGICYLAHNRLSEARTCVANYSGRADFPTKIMLRSIVSYLENKIPEALGLKLMAELSCLPVDLPSFCPSTDASLQSCDGHQTVKTFVMQTGKLKNDVLEAFLARVFGATDINGLQMKGVVFGLMRKFDLAEEVFYKTISMPGATHYNVLFFCGSAARNKKYPEVCSALKMILPYFTGEHAQRWVGFLHYLIGYCSYKQMEKKSQVSNELIREAIDHLGKAWSSGFSLECGVLMAYIHQRLGHHDIAIQWLGFVLEIRPTHCHALLARAMSLIFLNKESDAYWDFVRVSQLHPSCPVLKRLQQNFSRIVIRKN
eukprot:TRINITY_DN14610_c0_g1_i1.p1 TRINITY_DN14610_c0_g1~~TRINITY_DN14610_c0_g1_i1.p1  ORF type:complete len:609 (-),score=101.48 TRINITY_DN14610_c0_g1_i1:7-1788(-)